MSKISTNFIKNQETKRVFDAIIDNEGIPGTAMIKDPEVRTVVESILDKVPISTSSIADSEVRRVCDAIMEGF